MSDKVYYHDDEIEYSIIGYLMILIDKLFQ